MGCEGRTNRDIVRTDDRQDRATGRAAELDEKQPRTAADSDAASRATQNRRGARPRNRHKPGNSQKTPDKPRDKEEKEKHRLKPLMNLWFTD